jgi:hypothetical protein
MKKLIMLSVVCLFAIGTFASTGNKTKQDAAKKPATEKAAPAKTESKPAPKKEVKPVKETKKAEVKQTAPEKK